MNCLHWARAPGGASSAGRTALGLLSGLALSALLGAASPAQAQSEAATPAAASDLKLPPLNEMRLAVPRPVQAASALLGYGRQRLALVVGLGTIGSRQVLDSAARDAQAVATALRAGGFVVMVREDVSGADLRAALKEYRERQQPGGVGFVYVTGLGAQVAGQNLLLPRDTRLDASASAAEVAAQVKAAGVPLKEVVDALLSTPDSARMLVVDAAYAHPALAKLPQPGLAEERLPPGMLALFGHALSRTQEVPATAALPTPAPKDPREIASTRFARVLVSVLVTPRVSGTDALRHTHRALVDGAPEEPAPWLGGQSSNTDDLAEATLLDGLFPRSPEDLAREAVKQITRAALKTGAGGAGGAGAAELALAATPTTTPATGPDPLTAKPVGPGQPAAPNVPNVPPGPTALSAATSTLGTAASVAGTAATVATMAVAAQAAATSTAASTTAAAVGVGSSVAGSALGATARILSSSSGEQPARQAVQQIATAQAPLGGAAAVTVASAAATTALPAATANTAPGAGTASSGTAQNAPNAKPASASNALDGRTQRGAEGGERPVYNPRTNRYGYSEGDTFSYQVMDMWKEEVTSTFTTAIEEVLGDGQLLANGQALQMDAQGRIKSHSRPDGSVSRFEPRQDLWWADPKPGETRDVVFKEFFERPGAERGQVLFEGSASVGRLRKITTPAGEFEAMPIETSGYFNGALGNGVPRSGQFTRTVWYAPKLGHPVRIDITDSDRMGKLMVRERVELMHAQRVPQP